MTKRKKLAENEDDDALKTSRAFKKSNNNGFPETRDFGTANRIKRILPSAETMVAFATKVSFLVLTMKRFAVAGTLDRPMLTIASEAASTSLGKTDMTTGIGGG